MQRKYKHIAFADDDCDDQELLNHSLEKICPDITLTLVENGASLLNVLSSIPKPDLIMLDLNMPLVDGRECLKALKGDQEMKEIPVMIYSTSSSIKDIEECFSYGQSIM